MSKPTLSIKLLGTAGSAAAYTLRDYLQRSDVAFEWIELHSDEQARALAGVSGLRDTRLPVCIFSDGSRIDAPNIRQLTERLGWFHDATLAEYDVAIYGGGPAGLSAAVYGASEGLKTVLIERSALGGQAGSSSKIENYLGFPQGISGAELAERAREQACRFGAELLIAHEGVDGEFITGRGIGHLSDGSTIIARATICATGIAYRLLNLPDEQRFFGAGLYYGAGASEAALCGNEHIFVVGGGNSAGQAAMYFSRFAAKVTVIIRGASLKETLSQYLIERIYSAANIEVITETEVTALHGDAALESITLSNIKNGEKHDMPTRWLFVCIGGEPHTAWAERAGLVRDSEGYLVTGPDLFLKEYENGAQRWPLERPPYYLETNVPGMFAAGDVRHNSVKRCASAVGEGAMAITFVHRYLAGN